MHKLHCPFTGRLPINSSAIIKIDEPYFDAIRHIQQPQKILFTNPTTVEGTMERLHRHAHHLQKSLDVEVVVISDTFDLIMQGLKEKYTTIFESLTT